MFPEEINIAITHWKTSDGNVFTDQYAAMIHQAVIDGDARICPKCNGTGMVDHMAMEGLSFHAKNALVATNLKMKHGND